MNTVHQRKESRLGEKNKSILPAFVQFKRIQVVGPSDDIWAFEQAIATIHLGLALEALLISRSLAKVMVQKEVLSKKETNKHPHEQVAKTKPEPPNLLSWGVSADLHQGPTLPTTTTHRGLWLACQRPKTPDALPKLPVAPFGSSSPPRDHQTDGDERSKDTAARKMMWKNKRSKEVRGSFSWDFHELLSNRSKHRTPWDGKLHDKKHHTSLYPPEYNQQTLKTRKYFSFMDSKEVIQGPFLHPPNPKTNKKCGGLDLGHFQELPGEAANQEDLR